MRCSVKYALLGWVAASACSLAGCATAPGQVEKKELTRKERAVMYVQIANGALNEGDATGALEHLLRAEKEDPSLPELHHSKALAFFGKHDVVSATAEARRAIELRADYPDAHSTLGKLLLDQGRYDEAITVLLKPANNPVYREAFKPLTNLGIIHYRKGQYAKADEYLTRAIQSAPAAACIAYYYRGHLRLRESRFSDAAQDYDSAGRKVCAGFADAHLAQGMAYERGKQYDLARKKYLEIQNRYPNTKIAEQAISHLRYLP